MRSVLRMVTKRQLDEFCKLARQLGAIDAKVVSPRDVPTAEWVRLKCQYGCSEYGLHLTCPPYSPAPATTRKMLDEYQYGILIRGGRTRPLREIGVELERKIFLAGFYKAFALLCGPCSICGRCEVAAEGADPRRVSCQHPEKARPAMEAAGIDVFATARAAGFPIEVVTSATCEHNYYALVLIE